MSRLYDLTGAYAEIIARLDDCETQEQFDLLLESLTAIEADIVTKGENYARIIRNKAAESDAYAAEIKRLTARKRAADAAIERLKDNIHFALETAGYTELSTGIGKWKIAKNPPSVEITDESIIPEEYLIPQPAKVDRHKILDDYKELGLDIPGVEIVRKEGVRFR